MSGALQALLLLIAAAAGPSEYDVKAAFLFNFCKYVEWPESAFATPSEPISLCVLGENPFGSTLEDAVRSKTVNGRGLAVRSLASLSPDDRCHVVFVAASERSRLDNTIARLASHPVLTVTDIDSAAEHGTIIGLTTEENRVRFEVNLVAARQAGLKLGSQLLKVASRVIGQAPWK
jgi:hypothetical protein